MERNNNLSFFIIISFALHLSLLLLLRMDVLKHAIKGEDASTEVELLTIPQRGIIGDMPTKLQQFSSGRESGGIKGRGDAPQRPAVPPLPGGDDEVRVARRPSARPVRPIAPAVEAAKQMPREVSPPDEAAAPPTPTQSSSMASAPAPAPAPAAQAAPPPPPAAAERHPLPPPPPVPLFRDDAREAGRTDDRADEKSLDFPRLKIPFINQKDLEKFAKAEPKPVLPEKNKGMTLDLDEFKFGPYGMSIVEKVEKVWRYPDEAIKKGMQGALVVTFIINKDGAVKDLKLERSSGFGVLDEEAMRAVKTAAPFKPLPGNIGVVEFPVRFTFYYEIRQGRGIYVQ